MTVQDRHQFREIAGPKLNVGCGSDVRQEADGWVNLDGYVKAAGVVTHDVLATPWPFAAGTFELVYCSHVLEHVPPVFRHRDGVLRDALFEVMEEIHRVLKPGGLLCIRVPYGGGTEAMGHIQHYRQWRPEWAFFFTKGHAENYYTSARFEVEGWEITRGLEDMRWKHALRFGNPPIPLVAHLLARFPFLRRLLHRPAELEIRMRKA